MAKAQRKKPAEKSGTQPGRRSVKKSGKQPGTETNEVEITEGKTVQSTKDGESVLCVPNESE